MALQEWRDLRDQPALRDRPDPRDKRVLQGLQDLSAPPVPLGRRVTRESRGINKTQGKRPPRLVASFITSRTFNVAVSLGDSDLHAGKHLRLASISPSDRYEPLSNCGSWVVPLIEELKHQANPG